MPNLHRSMPGDGGCLSTTAANHDGSRYRKSGNVETLQPVGKDDPEYNMSHPGGRGYAIILNFTEFKNSTDYPERTYSKYDASIMVETYRALGFEENNIKVKDNLYRHEVMKLVDVDLLDETEYDFSDKDCLSITILSHGAKGLDMGGQFQTYDYPIRFTELWQSLSSDKIPALAGKPKLFFIDCSRGSEKDKGTTMETEGAETKPMENITSHYQVDRNNHYKKTYKLPTMADFLIAYSTSKGHHTYNETINSPFIEELSLVLSLNNYKENDKKEDLLSMMVMVTRRVATIFKDPLNHMKQCPSCTSTLIRKIYFRGENDLSLQGESSNSNAPPQSQPSQ